MGRRDDLINEYRGQLNISKTEQEWETRRKIRMEARRTSNRAPVLPVILSEVGLAALESDGEGVGASREAEVVADDVQVIAVR